MIETIVASSKLTVLDTLMFFRDTPHPVAIVDREGPEWVNPQYRDRRMLMPVVFPTLQLFQAQVQHAHAHPLRLAALVLCTPDECASYDLPQYDGAVWTYIFHRALLKYPSGATIKQFSTPTRDLVAEVTALKSYPAGKVVALVHPLFYRIPDKLRRAELQAAVWGWLASVSKTKPVTNFPIMQKILDTPEALVLRAATLYHQTHSMAETLQQFPDVDEFALGFLRSAINPKKRKVPTTESARGKPKPK